MNEFISKLQELLIPSDLLTDILNIVAETCDPEDVFDEDKLAKWALDNGFVDASTDD